MSKLEAEKIDVGWCDPGYVPGLFATSLAATVRDMEYHGCMGKVHRVSGSILTQLRNQVVERFLAGDAEWLWMVDSDMVFDMRHPMKLWETASEHQVKMVSGLAFIYDGQRPIPSIFYPSPEGGGEIGLMPGFIPDTPIVVPATGLASSLIHRSVFEAMQPSRSDKYRWFDIIPITDPDKLAGEDVQFFTRARELGFELMVNPEATTWHIKETAIGRPEWDRYWELQGALAQEEVDEQPRLVINHDED